MLLRCSCGQLIAQHPSPPVGNKEEEAPLVDVNVQTTEKWSILKHTRTSPTDTYGVVEFQGGGQVNKATVSLDPKGRMSSRLDSDPLSRLCSTSESPMTPNQTTCFI